MTDMVDAHLRSTVLPSGNLGSRVGSIGNVFELGGYINSSNSQAAKAAKPRSRETTRIVFLKRQTRADCAD